MAEQKKFKNQMRRIKDGERFECNENDKIEREKEERK